MDRLVTPPGRGTSPAWGPPLPCEQALKHKGGVFKFFWFEERFRKLRFRNGLLWMIDRRTWASYVLNFLRRRVEGALSGLIHHYPSDLGISYRGPDHLKKKRSLIENS